MMNNKGVALLTVLVVMVIGIGLTALISLLILKGYQTSRVAKNYQIALHMAQGELEQAISQQIRTSSYGKLQRFISLPLPAGRYYEINEVFQKHLAGFGGAPEFPPTRAAHGGLNTGVYYLVHARTLWPPWQNWPNGPIPQDWDGSQADLYILYIKGY